MLDQVAVSELASELNLELVGNSDVVVHDVASLDEAEKGCLSFIRSSKYMKYINTTQASAIIVPKEVELPDSDKAYLLSEDPYISFASILQKYYVKDEKYDGVSQQAFLSENVQVGEKIKIEPFVYVDINTKIGNCCSIKSGTRIGKNVKIGNHVVIHGNVTIEDNSVIGDRVILNPGVVVGSDGFGYTQTDDGNVKLPQIGNVIIEDDVEVGANSTIDRGSLGATIIGKGTKIDNLVQIGHGAVLGKHNVVCSQTGIAGSVQSGEKVIFASRAGVGDHLKIGKGSTIGPMAGVTKDLPEDSLVSGFPAMPHQDWLKMVGVMSQLPQFREQLRMFKKQN